MTITVTRLSFFGIILVDAALILLNASTTTATAAATVPSSFIRRRAIDTEEVSINTTASFSSSITPSYETTTINNPFENQNPHFGSSVALNGPGNRLAVASAGLVAVLQLTNNQQQWQQLGPELLGGPAVALSADGNRVATSQTDGTGLVYEFDSTLNNWTLVGDPILAAPWSRQSSNVAIAMSKDGHVVALGHPKIGFDPESTTGLCRVFVFDITNHTWIQQGQDLVSVIDDNQQNDDRLFGSQVSLSGDGQTVVCGGGATTQLYEFSDDKDGNWVLASSYTARNNNAVHVVAASTSSVTLSRDGTTLAMMASTMQEDDHITNKNNNNVTVAIHEYNEGEGGWHLDIANHILPIIMADEVGHRGIQLALSDNGNFLAIGNPQDRFHPGQVQLYQLVNDNDYNNKKEWQPINNDIMGSHSLVGSHPGAAFGSSLALSQDGTTVAVGSPDFSPDDGLHYMGQVHVYDFAAGKDNNIDDDNNDAPTILDNTAAVVGRSGNLDGDGGP